MGHHVSLEHDGVTVSLNLGVMPGISEVDPVEGKDERESQFLATYASSTPSADLIPPGLRELLEASGFTI